MKNILPKWIQTAYQNNREEGHLTASTMFIDVSGFTQMTEVLMKKGDEGAEILSNILNKIFNPILNVIYKRGGFISTFAGDAFTALFPIEITQPSQVLYCAHKIQSIFETEGLQQTSFGDFQLKVKVGLSYGNVEWGIIGQTDKAYFFRGDAINGCAYSEHHAEKGDIILDETLRAILPAESVEIETITDGYFRLQKLLDFQNARKLPPIPPQPRLSKKIIRQFFPESVIEFSQQGEFRNVASVFISFEGITTKEEIDMFVSLILEKIDHFSGYFNKIDFGDKGNVILCLFGAPVAFENNVERALDFILDVRKDIANTPHLKMRAGITYGMVYAGIVGGQKRAEYTALGDIVNLSARFMMKANFGELWVAERIQRYTNKVYEYSFLGGFSFKGKSEDIPAYLLAGKRDITREDSFTGKFVGRGYELEQVQERFDKIKVNQFGGLVYVYGEAGVGKSRFVFELQKKNQNVKWLYLPCDDVLRKSFNVFHRFLNNFFEQLSEQSREENKQTFDQIYQTLVQNSPLFGPELMRLQSIIEGFLGIHDLSENSLYNQLDAKLRYENTVYAFGVIFRALSQKSPIVIEIEDLQWIDDDSLHAFEVFCRSGIQTFPITLIITSRYYDDDAKPALSVDIHTLEIDLQTLSPEGTAEFAESILERKISQNFINNLVEKTNGNPFFIEQTTFYYRETNVLTYDYQHQIWDVTGDESAIPDTINDLLIARVDRLSAKLKEAVQTASVIGNEFDIHILLDVLKQISGSWTQKDVEMFLEKGHHSKVWSILSEIKGIFAHAMMRDVVYLMQLKSRLRRLHGLIAKTIELSSANNPAFYADLAFHYDHAEAIDKALEYLKKAGNYAQDNFQNQQALDFYNRWIVLFKQKFEITDDDFSQVSVDDQEWITTYIDLLAFGRVFLLGLLGQIDAAQNDIEITYQLAEQIDDKDRLAIAMLGIGDMFRFKGNYGEAITYFEKALPLLQATDNQKMIGTVYFKMGSVLLDIGKPQEAHHYFEKELDIRKKMDDRLRIAKALGNIGVVYDITGDSRKAMQYYAKQLQIYEDLDHKIEIANTTGNIGVVYHVTGDYDTAIDYYEKKLKLCEELGYRKEIVVALSNLGVAYYEKGDYQAAINYHQRALQLNHELDYTMGIAVVLANMAHTHKALTNYDQALEYYNQGLQLVQKLGINSLLAEYLIEKAELLLLQNQLNEAKKLCDKGLKAAVETNNQEYLTKGKTILDKINSVSN